MNFVTEVLLTCEECKETKMSIPKYNFRKNYVNIFCDKKHQQYFDLDICEKCEHASKIYLESRNKFYFGTMCMKSDCKNTTEKEGGLMEFFDSNEYRKFLEIIDENRINHFKNNHDYESFCFIYLLNLFENVFEMIAPNIKLQFKAPDSKNNKSLVDFVIQNIEFEVTKNIYFEKANKSLVETISQAIEKKLEKIKDKMINLVIIDVLPNYFEIAQTWFMNDKKTPTWQDVEKIIHKYEEKNPDKINSISFISNRFFLMKENSNSIYFDNFYRTYNNHKTNPLSKLWHNWSIYNIDKLDQFKKFIKDKDIVFEEFEIFQTNKSSEKIVKNMKNEIKY